MLYDLIVVGGGPAGLTAAKIAVERNLNVVLVETRKEVAEITRTCSQMLHLVPGLYNDDIRFQDQKIIFPHHDFSLTFRGAAYALYHKYAFSPAGHKLYMTQQNPPMGVTIDKGALLRELQNAGEKAGLTVHTNCTALKAENTHAGVRVQINRNGQKSWLEGRMLIAADGVNSRMVESLGINEHRQLRGTGGLVGYTFDNVDNPYPHSIFKFIGTAYAPTTRMVYLNSTPWGYQTCFVLAKKEAADHFVKKGKVASWFKNARLIQKRSAVVKSRPPILEPLLGNVLIVGDAAGTTEVLIQGALLCGFKAGHAVANALEATTMEERKRKLWEYVDFWRSTIDYVKDPGIMPTIGKGVYLYPSFTDEEIDYIFSLTNDDTFPAELNPFSLLRHDMRNIWKYKEKIQTDRPDIYHKILDYLKDTRVTLADLEGA